MIKLLALDLDGTTLNSRGEIPAANRIAIDKAEKAGVLVTIATGRRFRDARPIGLELGLNAPLITHNGGLLKYADTFATVAFSLLSAETGLEIIALGKSFGGDALVSVDPHGYGTLLFDTVSDDNIPLQKYLNWSKSLHGGNADHSVIHVDALENVVSGHEIVHISFSGNCASMHHLDARLREELGASATVLSTIYPRLDFTLIDILPPDTSKGHGVARLAAISGIAREETMAIGDNFNDLEMLDFAGTAVVMGNADERLRDHPEFYTTLSNDDAGVADAIGRFILDQENI
jgi:Cof subfamily protein (haloacid dehalogenase superfamily)